MAAVGLAVGRRQIQLGVGDGSDHGADPGALSGIIGVHDPPSTVLDSRMTILRGYSTINRVAGFHHNARRLIALHNLPSLTFCIIKVSRGALLNIRIILHGQYLSCPMA